MGFGAWTSPPSSSVPCRQDDLLMGLGKVCECPSGTQLHRCYWVVLPILLWQHKQLPFSHLKNTDVENTAGMNGWNDFMSLEHHLTGKSVPCRLYWFISTLDYTAIIDLAAKPNVSVGTPWFPGKMSDTLSNLNSHVQPDYCTSCASCLWTPLSFWEVIMSIASNDACHTASCAECRWSWVWLSSWQCW